MLLELDRVVRKLAPEVADGQPGRLPSFLPWVIVPIHDSTNGVPDGVPDQLARSVQQSRCVFCCSLWATPSLKRG